jgi:hypothetical protein
MFMFILTPHAPYAMIILLNQKMNEVALFYFHF